MGCLFSRSAAHEEERDGSSSAAKTAYSWDNRQKVDPSQYTVADLEGGCSGRMPGEVNGQQLIIRNCKNAAVYVLDNSATVTIDDCVGSTIILGPVKGSVFVRDCKECKLLVACQQFRTRDCKRIHIFLSCKSQPIIEASTEMYFGCYQCYYSELSSQFDRADLNVFHNCWDSVHDFTPVQEETNWGLIPRNVEVGQHISVPSQAPYSNVGISYDARKSVVPLTSGGPVDGTHDQEHCLVVLDSAMDKNSVHHLVQELSLQGLMLVRMKCFELDCEGVRTLFPAAEKSAWGSIIALDLCGVNAITISHQVTSDNVHVKFKSLDSDKGMSDVEALFNLSDFNMN